MGVLAAGLRTPRRRGGGFTVGVAAGAAVPLLLALGVVVAERSDPAPARTGGLGATLTTERAAFRAYETAIEPLIEQGASVVVYGMRPGVADIADGRFPDETLETMARGWVGSMERLRDSFAAVDPPRFLGEVAEGFDRSLAAYIETARAELAAARASGDERARLVERAAVLGDRADGLFDDAKAAWDGHRDRLGVGTRVEADR